MRHRLRGRVGQALGNLDSQRLARTWAELVAKRAQQLWRRHQHELGEGAGCAHLLYGGGDFLGEQLQLVLLGAIVRFDRVAAESMTVEGVAGDIAGEIPLLGATFRMLQRLDRLQGGGVVITGV